jgi:hypothetical protein
MNNGDDSRFMYRRPILCTLYGAVDFLNVLKITIKVPVVFMALYVMVLRSATALRGALEGGGPENREMARAKRVPFGPKKVGQIVSSPYPYPMR